MKVGIDLSSTNTGLVILSDDNKLIWHGNFKLWDNSSQKPNRVFVRELFDVINLKRLNKLEKITIGVELSDFGNWKYADRFNFIAGALYQEHYCQEWGMMGEFICFNSNEWQRFLLEHYEKNVSLEEETETKICYDDGLKYEKVIIHQYYVIRNLPFLSTQIRIEKDERKLRKTLARCFAKEHLNNHIDYDDNWTEDECDAYCIAYFLPQLRDRTQMHQEVKAKKVQAKKSKVQELRDKIKAYDKAKKLYEKVNHYKDIANVKKLTKSQQRALEKAEMELKEYEKDK